MNDEGLIVEYVRRTEAFHDRLARHVDELGRSHARTEIIVERMQQDLASMHSWKERVGPVIENSRLHTHAITKLLWYVLAAIAGGVGVILLERLKTGG